MAAASTHHRHAMAPQSWQRPRPSSRRAPRRLASRPACETRRVCRCTQLCRWRRRRDGEAGGVNPYRTDGELPNAREWPASIIARARVSVSDGCRSAIGLPAESRRTAMRPSRTSTAGGQAVRSGHVGLSLPRGPVSRKGIGIADGLSRGRRPLPGTKITRSPCPETRPRAELPSSALPPSPSLFDSKHHSAELFRDAAT